MSDVNKPHVASFHHDEHVLYPPHESRTETPEFRAARKHLIEVLDTPCYVCGVRHSGGARLESHHLFGEYSLTNALDIAKINADHPHFTQNNDEAIDTVDAEGNQLVLCEWCHRGKPTYQALHHPRNKHKTAGIHELTFPIWIAQKYRLAGVEILADAVDKEE